MVLRERSYDYKFRYCGHCNTTTDIKEANFFGRLTMRLFLMRWFQWSVEEFEQVSY